MERKYITKEQELESKEKELRRDFYHLEEDSDNIIKEYKPAHDQFTQDIAKAREEIDDLQFAHDEQKTELDNYNKEFEDMWSTQDFAIDMPEHEMPQEEAEGGVLQDEVEREVPQDKGQSGTIEEKAKHEVIQPEQEERAERQGEVGSEIVQDEAERDEIVHGKVQEKVKQRQAISERMVQIEETVQKSEDEMRHLEKFQQKLKEKLQEERRKIK